MLSLSSGVRLALVLSMSLGSVAWQVNSAYADDDDEEEDDGGDEDGDEGDGGSDDESEDEDEDPKDQPALTSGGLFTLRSYPVREISRPLSMTQRLVQLRLAL